jgi:hypothetical protein
LRPTRQAAQDTVEPELPPPLEERQATDAAPLDLASARRLWPRIRQRLLREFPAAKAILTDAVSVSAAEGSKVTLDFPNDFMKQKAEGPRAKEKIEGAFAVEARLERVRVLCRVAASDPDHEADEPSQMRLENDSPPLEGVAPPAQHGGGEALEEEQALLQQVIEEFRGTIVSEGGTRSGA